MVVEELYNILRQFPRGLPVICFNSEGDEIIKIPDEIPDIVVGSQTVNNKEVTVILCRKKGVKDSVKIQPDNSNGRNGIIEDSPIDRREERFHDIKGRTAPKKNRRKQKSKS